MLCFDHILVAHQDYITTENNAPKVNYTTSTTRMEFPGQTSPVSRHLLFNLDSDLVEENWTTLMTPKINHGLSTLLGRVSLQSPRKESTGKTATTKRKLFASSNKRKFDCQSSGGSLKRFCTSADIYSTRQQEEPIKKTPKKEENQNAVHCLLDNDNLIGDGSQSHSLPTIPGKHVDLKSISSQTMADLLSGKYDDIEYRIIDCRYPYEYNGGHIKGAENRHTDEMILEMLDTKATEYPESNKRSVIIFHCEFSSERGPKKCRFLRNKDRKMNQENYPLLKFPELYILDGGYCQFYKQFETFCAPNGYTPMLDKSHSDDLRYFRKKSKTWTTGDKRRISFQSFRV